MIALLLSPLGRWLGGAALVVAALYGVWLWGDAHGTAKLAAYKVQVQAAYDAEALRQKTFGSVAIAALQSQLDDVTDALTDAQKAVADRQTQLDAKPKVAGRGATKEDADALDR